MVVGSFKKIVDPQRIEFIPQVQSVVDPGVTGSKHMGDTSTRLVRFPTLIVPEQAGHSVASVVTATNPLSCSLGPTVTCRDGTCFHHTGSVFLKNLMEPKLANLFWNPALLPQVRSKRTPKSIPVGFFPSWKQQSWFDAPLSQKALEPG